MATNNNLFSASSQLAELYRKQQEAIALQKQQAQGMAGQTAQYGQQQLANELRKAQQDYNLNRQQMQEQAFLQNRQLAQSAQSRGLAGSGLAQLGGLQQQMAYNAGVSELAQQQGAIRLEGAQQSQQINSNLANQLGQANLNATQQEASLAESEYQRKQELATTLYSMAREGANMTDADWAFLQQNYGVSDAGLSTLKEIWGSAKISDIGKVVPDDYSWGNFGTSAGSNGNFKFGDVIDARVSSVEEAAQLVKNLLVSKGVPLANEIEVRVDEGGLLGMYRTYFYYNGKKYDSLEKLYKAAQKAQS